ncbi:MAG: hypothetical protein A2V88_15275 [Elusimicrobia bacterium RBG_16_66_12]|nr:MAG: hypothetical protein A2V88_15275 [Elusimicrobia bacterium RBG_16_66_12]
MRPNTDHVVCDAKDGGAFRCLHCGDRHMPTFPQPLAVFCESAKGYALMHKHCQPRPEPTKQVALFDALVEQETNHTRVIQPHHDDAYAIDGMSDEPDPETDPPGPALPGRASDMLRELAEDDAEPQEHDKPELTDQDDPFGQRYPMARDHLRLKTNLSVVLQGVLTPTLEQLQALPVGSAAFDKIAHWTRIESARMNLTEHPELEVYLPTGQAMPKELAAMRRALKEGEPKKKRGARPLSSPEKRRGTEGTA